MPKPKKIPWEMLDREHQPEMYELLDELITEHHDELFNARVALAFNTSWKPDTDGHRTIGRCRKVSDLEREWMPFDFIILLHKEFWTSPEVTDEQRRALLDHELCHAGVAVDRDGEPKLDERDRLVFRTKKHTVEEFHEIITRHGIWKYELETFWETLQKAKQRSAPEPARAAGTLGS